MGSVVFTHSNTRYARWTALDDSDAAKTIRESIDTDIAKAHEKAAKRFLKLFRGRLSKFNTKRHTIRIVAGMGMHDILVDGESITHGKWNNYNGNAGIMQELRDIEEFMDCDWSCYLDGERLN